MILHVVLIPIPAYQETTFDFNIGINAYELAIAGHDEIEKMISEVRTSYSVELTSELIEEPGEDFNCLMYATVPIGRYYITAYNHEETGSKITASGKTCHEGAITTCAADVPKYFRFGDVIEVDSRLYIVEDTGSAVKKKHIDLYFSSYKAMSRYGSNYQNIYKVEFPFGKPKGV